MVISAAAKNLRCTNLHGLFSADLLQNPPEVSSVGLDVTHLKQAAGLDKQPRLKPNTKMSILGLEGRAFQKI